MKTKFILSQPHVDEIHSAIVDYHRVMPGRYVYEPSFEVTVGGNFSFYASSQEIKSLIRCLTYYGSNTFFVKTVICELVDQFIDSSLW